MSDSDASRVKNEQPLHTHTDTNLGESNLQIHSVHFVKSTSIILNFELIDSHTHTNTSGNTSLLRIERLEAMVIKLLITIKVRIT